MAKLIGCNRSAISQFLNYPDDYKTSEMVLPMMIAMKTGEPVTEEWTDDDLSLLADLRQLRSVDENAYQAILTLIRGRLPPGST